MAPQDAAAGVLGAVERPLDPPQHYSAKERCSVMIARPSGSG